MQKLRVRNGCMFRCAWDPPTFPSVFGAIAWRFPAGRVKEREVRLSRHPGGRGAVGVRIGLGGRGVRDMVMLRQLGDRERVRLLAAALAEGVPAADVDRRAASKVGQGEVDPAVAAERRSQQREQRLVLVDRQQLTVAQRPSLRGELEPHDPDLGQEWLGHAQAPLMVRCRSSSTRTSWPRGRRRRCRRPRRARVLAAQNFRRSAVRVSDGPRPSMPNVFPRLNFSRVNC